MTKGMDLLVIFGLMVACSWTPSAAGPIETSPDVTKTISEAVQPLSFQSACSNSDGSLGFINCAAYRALRSLQQYNQQQSIEIIPGVTFSRDTPLSQRSGKSMEDESLPSNPEDKMQKLFALIFETAAQILSGRTFAVKVPESAVQNTVRAFEEGRGKMKKMMGPFMLAMGAKLVTMVPLLFGGLALLVTKALLVAKVALVLAVIVGMQYFVGGGGIRLPLVGGGGGSGWNSYGSSGTGWTTNQVGGGWNNQQYPYARSFDKNEQSAQDLAYAAQKQE